MANLNIPFPEGPRTVVLRGARITIGRLPDNTIQIRDRTVSAHHAELIMEGGHYRIHDSGSSNGVLVNGQQVEDFHLEENCTIRLGNLDCQFQAVAPSDEPNLETLPGRGEVNAMRQENQELKATMAALQAQVETMEQARNGSDGDGLGQLAAERAALQMAKHQNEAEIVRLKESLAVITRDRDNLQRAYDETKGAVVAKPVPAASAVPPPPSALAKPTTIPLTPTAPPPPPRGRSPRLSAPRPKPPTSLGSAGTAGPSPTTPVRRPPSAVQMPPVRVLGTPVATVGATGPKGTQKLVE